VEFKGVLLIFSHTCGVDSIETSDGVLGEGTDDGKRVGSAK
jgi:hypothetical protein